MKYGYVRVSSREQNIDRQMTAMKEQGIAEEKIFVDRATGKNFNRKGYKRMMRKVKPGDEIFIKSIDRLGRNYDEIITQWKIITKDKAVHIVVIDFPLLDTRKHVNGLTGTFIADLVLQVLSYVAQIERENTHKRQLEGIREARKRGVRFGRRPIAKPDNFDEVAALWQNGQVSLRAGAKLLNVSHATFSKWLKTI
ncbi:recombinase family protein [Pseudoramibacter alactolyticus]|jgi:DNA invertase Pin-like site-specific DNA recombinase|uniref:recombinase family protein n=1 Tax=Pseudoramibacter alactolyticus TaxID=113287 RepID=UPI002355DEAB|nr:recombinase family protein [Pseudoramibacter alactolyticus]MBM6968814.1 recombinase family protein [Pseudoramibacter alactolyticus]